MKVMLEIPEYYENAFRYDRMQGVMEQLKMTTGIGYGTNQDFDMHDTDMFLMLCDALAKSEIVEEQMQEQMPTFTKDSVNLDMGRKQKTEIQR